MPAAGLTIPAPPPEVAEVFARVPPEARAGLDRLRVLIFHVAREVGAGLVTEGLRWGAPAYLAQKGSTLRLGVPKTAQFALFFNCRTSVIAEFRAIAPVGTRFEGTRAVLFDRPGQIDDAALAIPIARALTWHRRGRR